MKERGMGNSTPLVQTSGNFSSDVDDSLKSLLEINYSEEERKFLNSLGDVNVGSMFEELQWDQEDQDCFGRFAELGLEGEGFGQQETIMKDAPSPTPQGDGIENGSGGKHTEIMENVDSTKNPGNDRVDVSDASKNDMDLIKKGIKNGRGDISLTKEDDGGAQNDDDDLNMIWDSADDDASSPPDLINEVLFQLSNVTLTPKSSRDPDMPILTPHRDHYQDFNCKK